jgi:hypothetical protein
MSDFPEVTPGHFVNLAHVRSVSFDHDTVTLTYGEAEGQLLCETIDVDALHPSFRARFQYMSLPSHSGHGDLEEG